MILTRRDKVVHVESSILLKVMQKIVRGRTQDVLSVPRTPAAVLGRSKMNVGFEEDDWLSAAPFKHGCGYRDITR